MTTSAEEVKTEQAVNQKLSSSPMDVTEIRGNANPMLKLVPLEDKFDISQDDIIRELALICSADMADFIEIDENGFLRMIPLEQLEEGKSRAIKKVKMRQVIRKTQCTESNPEGDQTIKTTFEFELFNKVKGMEQLARLLHNKVAKKDVKPLTVKELTDEELLSIASRGRRGNYKKEESLQ